MTSSLKIYHSLHQQEAIDSTEKLDDDYLDVISSQQLTKVKSEATQPSVIAIINDNVKKINSTAENNREYEQKTCSLKPGQGQRLKNRPQLDIRQFMRQSKRLCK